MDLAKLFETQKILRDRIGYNEPDRFDKLILALSVELGECANEWRGFKFWSKNQEARTKMTVCRDGIYRDKNPLLEEYVDGLHFVLELGLEKGYTVEELLPSTSTSITKLFNFIFTKVGDFSLYKTFGNYEQIFDAYMGLGEMLGFTWEEIEDAYFTKNEINHERQESGY